MNIKSIDNKTKEIILCIIARGGMYGDIARMYQNDTEKSYFFILECSKQCHTSLTYIYWGNKLTNEIEQYKNSYGNLIQSNNTL